MLIKAISADHVEDYVVVVGVDSGSGSYVVQQRFMGLGDAPFATSWSLRGKSDRTTTADLFTAVTAAAAAKYVQGFLTAKEEVNPYATGEYSDLPTCSEFLNAEIARQEAAAATLERQVERDLLTQRIAAWDAMPSLSDADWAARRRARRRLAKLPNQNSKRLT